MKDDRNYKDFNDALFELKKKNYDISYGRIAKKTGLLEATVTALANRRRANPPDDEVMIKIAEAFNVKPEYFYDWRLKRFLEFVNDNREFLDHVEKESKRFTKKGVSPAPVQDDSEENTDEPDKSA